VSIDDQSINADRLEFVSYSTLYSMYDKNNRYAGTAGGNITACTLGKLGPGSHAINVEVSTLSEVIYSYSWAFTII